MNVYNSLDDSEKSVEFTQNSHHTCHGGGSDDTDQPQVSFQHQPGAVPTLAARPVRERRNRVAYLRLDIAEDGGLVPGYELKMNSYDLGVDIERTTRPRRALEHPRCARSW